jgi:hypothetical protein
MLRQASPHPTIMRDAFRGIVIKLLPSGDGIVICDPSHYITAFSLASGQNSALMLEPPMLHFPFCISAPVSGPTRKGDE